MIIKFLFSFLLTFTFSLIGLTSVSRGIFSLVIKSEKFLKKISAILFAVISIKRDPTLAILPPTFASTSYESFVPSSESSNLTLASPEANPTGELPDPSMT